MSTTVSQALKESTRAWLEAICPVGSRVRLGSCEYTDEKVLLRTPFEHRFWMLLAQFEEQAEVL